MQQQHHVNNSYTSGSTQRSLSHVVGAAGQNMMIASTVEGNAAANAAVYERAARQHQALVNQHLSLQQVPPTSGPKSSNTSKVIANPLDAKASAVGGGSVVHGKPPSNSQ